MVVGDTTVNAAGRVVKPTLTSVAPVKLLPVMVTVVPAGPLVGVMGVREGAGGEGEGGVTLKTRPITPLNTNPPLWTWAPAKLSITSVCAVRAKAGTVALMTVGDTTVNGAPCPMEMPSTPVKFVPVMVTSVPTGPLVGAMEVIVGVGAGGDGGGDPGEMVNIPPTPPRLPRLPLEATPTVLATRTLAAPVTPGGTVAVRVVGDSTLNDAGAVVAPTWKVTAFTPPRLVPVIVTVVPAGPLVGLRSEMVGRFGGAVGGQTATNPATDG